MGMYECRVHWLNDAEVEAKKDNLVVYAESYSDAVYRINCIYEDLLIDIHIAEMGSDDVYRWNPKENFQF